MANLIGGFYFPTSGSVFLDGKNTVLHDNKDLRDRIGVVPQKATLFAGSIRSNLLWGKEDATEEELWEALELAQAKEFVEQKEDGLDAAVEQQGRNLSGGQRQRLTVARALVRRPSILILDDSASALDYGTESRLRRAIATLPYNPTRFIISQRTSSILHADLIIVLEDGEMVGQGKHEELLRDCPVYREIYESQYEKGGEQNG